MLELLFLVIILASYWHGKCTSRSTNTNLSWWVAKSQKTSACIIVHNINCVNTIRVNEFTLNRWSQQTHHPNSLSCYTCTCTYIYSYSCGHIWFTKKHACMHTAHDINLYQVDKTISTHIVAQSLLKINTDQHRHHLPWQVAFEQNIIDNDDIVWLGQQDFITCYSRNRKTPLFTAERLYGEKLRGKNYKVRNGNMEHI